MNGNCSDQYKKYEIIPAVVMPAEAGKWLSIVAKLGHIAVSILVMHCAPYAVWTPNQKSARIARVTIGK
jgi:hypothetical protein